MIINDQHVIPVASARSKTHFIANSSIGFATGDNNHRVLCGTTLDVTQIWDKSATEGIVDTHHRLGTTHETYTCGKCVKRIDNLIA